MKYKVTEKHEFLKEGSLSFFSDKISYENPDCDFTYILDFDRKGHEKNWIESGWIEEIQKVEFTKNDMIEFAEYHDSGSPFSAKNMFNDWIEEKKLDENKNKQ